jgi:hypothetical protein
MWENEIKKAVGSPAPQRAYPCGLSQTPPPSVFVGKRAAVLLMMSRAKKRVSGHNARCGEFGGAAAAWGAASAGDRVEWIGRVPRLSRAYESR